MTEKTFTYTARSQRDPEKAATFTLRNGQVSIQLGTAMLEQLESAARTSEETEGFNFTAWAKPAAAGAVQRMLQPVPIGDFDADLRDESLRTTMWMRTGGLRLAPLLITWQEVDNPAGAEAFVSEVEKRKQTTPSTRAMPSILDYWLGWAAAAASLVVFVTLVSRMLKRRGEEEEESSA